MLTYRNTSIIFLTALVAAAVINIYWPGGHYLMLAVPLVYICFLIFGSVFVCSGFYMKVSCRGRGDAKNIALSFDDGPDPLITGELLDLLQEHGISAAFFCIGKKVEDHPEVVARMAREGHLVGSHSWSHSPFFDLFSARHMEKELEKTDMAIERATGSKPEWFRPPFGVTNPFLAAAAQKRAYRVMGWSVRSFDTSGKDVEKIMARIVKGWKPGVIILLHDTDQKAIRLTRRIIGEAKVRGYSFVRADELCRENMA